MTKFSGKVEIQDSISKKPKKPNTRITLDGDKSVISVGGSGRNGDLVLYDVARNERVSLGVENPLTCQDKAGKNVFEIFDATVAGLLVGTDKEKGGGKSGLIVIRDKRGKNSIYLDGANSLIDLEILPIRLLLSN